MYFFSANEFTFELIAEVKSFNGIGCYPCSRLLIRRQVNIMMRISKVQNIKYLSILHRAHRIRNIFFHLICVL